MDHNLLMSDGPVLLSEIASSNCSSTVKKGRGNCRQFFGTNGLELIKCSSKRASTLAFKIQDNLIILTILAKAFNILTLPHSCFGK
jgi:hypothetical protein